MKTKQRLKTTDLTESTETHEASQDLFFACVALFLLLCAAIANTALRL